MMTRLFSITFCLASLLTPLSAIAQTDEQTESSTKPVTYVYVTRPTHLDGFSVASNGKLTAVPGSPFANISVQGLVGNNKYLFGVNGNAVDAFSIATNGSIKLAATNAINEPSGSCGIGGQLSIDRTGATLYPVAIVNSLCEGSDYVSYQIESGGKLKYLGDSGQTFLWNSPLTFSSNNKYSYGTECIDYEGGFLDTFWGYGRSSSGHMTLDSGISTPDINPENSDDYYCAKAVAADSSGHLAVSLQAISNSTDAPDGEAQLATMTISSSGKLSSASTWKNMPSTGTGATALAFAPSGKLLAVGGGGLFGGGGGFQIFHFNGSSPITKESSVQQSKVTFQAFAWDNANHLFALGNGELFVYTVTSSSVTEAPGSPYSIPESTGVLVQSVTP
jgi:hypothetical protein